MANSSLFLGYSRATGSFLTSSGLRIEVVSVFFDYFSSLMSILLSFLFKLSIMLYSDSSKGILLIS